MLINVKRNLLNILGPRFKNKIVVIESDDWGSIRMPSLETYDILQKQGFSPEIDPYLKYDSLASKKDMEALFEVLSSVKDQNNNSAILTANVVMGNPNFEKIKKNNFQKYYWEKFSCTMRKYPHCDGVENTWKKGQQEKLIHFQCHGREHLNVGQWLRDLQKNDKLLKKAFDLKMLSISSEPSKLRFSYMEGLDYFSSTEKLEKKIILEEALSEFHNYFGFKSESYIANCYIWDDFIEKILAENGVRLIQGISNQIIPVLQKNGKHLHKYKRHYTGEKNKFNQTYLVRNAFFEPSLRPDYDWISDCLNRIRIAFRWGKPAIIGSHRINFIGSIHEENRTKNLVLFKNLLNQITKHWPDVEFYTSDKLFKN